MSETKPLISVEEIFAKVERGINRDPHTALKIGARYLFKIQGEKGGVFHLDLKQDLEVSREEKPADCEMVIRDRDFIKLYKGILPGYKAILNGKLKVKGDLTLAAKLSEIFSQTRQKKQS